MCFVTIVVYLDVCLILWSSSEGAIGKVSVRVQEGASDSGHKKGGASEGPAAWCLHSNRWRADLPGLSLRVPWGLVGAPPAQVREHQKTLPFELFNFYFLQVQFEGLNLYSSSWITVSVVQLNTTALFQGQHIKLEIRDEQIPLLYEILVSFSPLSSKGSKRSQQLWCVPSLTW